MSGYGPIVNHLGCDDFDVSLAAEICSPVQPIHCIDIENPNSHEWTRLQNPKRSVAVADVMAV